MIYKKPKPAQEIFDILAAKMWKTFYYDHSPEREANLEDLYQKLELLKKDVSTNT